MLKSIKHKMPTIVTLVYVRAAKLYYCFSYVLTGIGIALGLQYSISKLRSLELSVVKSSLKPQLLYTSDSTMASG